MRIVKRAALKRFDLLDNLSRVIRIDAILDLYRRYNHMPYLTRTDYIFQRRTLECQSRVFQNENALCAYSAQSKNLK